MRYNIMHAYTYFVTPIIDKVMTVWKAAWKFRHWAVDSKEELKMTTSDAICH